MKHKVVYNACFGGFGLSEEASELLNTLKGAEVCNPEYGYIDDSSVKRHDKDLVWVVEHLGTKAASGMCAALRVAEINSNVYRIDEYDGRESVQVPDSIDWVVIS